MLILKDHSAVGILSSLVGILTTHKCESHHSRIVVTRCRHCPADTAAVSVRIGKAVPIDFATLESAHHYATGPISRLRNRRFGKRDHLTEAFIFCNFQGKLVRLLSVYWRA